MYVFECTILPFMCTNMVESDKRKVGKNGELITAVMKTSQSLMMPFTSASRRRTNSTTTSFVCHVRSQIGVTTIFLSAFFFNPPDMMSSSQQAQVCRSYPGNITVTPDPNRPCNFFFSVYHHFGVHLTV